MAPREIAFHVIAEGRQFATFEDYARSIVDVPIEAADDTGILTGVQEDWDRFAEQVDHLWSIAEKIGQSAKINSPEGTIEPDKSVWDDLVSARARRLADDARITTFDLLGENHSAVQILEGRLDSSGAPSKIEMR